MSNLALVQLITPGLGHGPPLRGGILSMVYSTSTTSSVRIRIIAFIWFAIASKHGRNVVADVAVWWYVRMLFAGVVSFDDN